jgi:hypothetical protein
MSRKRRYSFFITEELDEALKALKERDGIAEAEAIRRALTAYLAERGVLSGGSTREAAPRRASTRRKA